MGHEGGHLAVRRWHLIILGSALYGLDALIVFSQAPPTGADMLNASALVLLCVAIFIVGTAMLLAGTSRRG